MSVIWLKDWLLTPLMLLSALAYLFFGQARVWTAVTFAPSDALKIIGGVIIVTGFVLKLLAYRTLGRNWSAKANVYDDHQLITSGPYKVIRHPVYASYLLTFAGFGMLSGNLLFIFYAVAYHSLNLIRAKQEEKMLLARFGGQYRRYLQETSMYATAPVAVLVIICNLLGIIDEMIYWPLTGNSFTFDWGYRLWQTLSN
ncbi:isoprenylcysteine carboxylmethyltransferase family protein [Candidatus Falkowbacteria bacterium]|nr:isoprenylcysteine carboxylmethyltransferase family protein [Candidatus Falkowbacteria bacterium]